MNENLISDSQWSVWAMELADLQKKYPDIAEKVTYAEDFEDWDGSSGAFLIYSNKPNIILTATWLIQNKRKKQNPVVSIPSPKKPLINKTSPAKKKLF
jgi:hypothetical protein